MKLLRIFFFTHCKAVANFESYKINLEKGSVISQMNDENAKLIKENRHYMATLCEILLIIAQQKIGIRESSLFRTSAVENEGIIDFGPYSGNFLSLLALIGNHDEIIARKIRNGPGNAKYTHHTVRNALLDIMAEEVKNIIFQEIHEAEYFSLLADETKDVSKKEQLSVAVRYLNEGTVHEEFLCIQELESLNAEGLAGNILNSLQNKLNFEKCIAQAYDGASVVSGKHAGVNAIIKERAAPSAYYIHCFNHRLNLILLDVAKSIQSLRNCLSLLQKLYTFVSCSSIHIKWVKMQTEQGVKVVELKSISNTRWAYQALMLNAVCSRFILLHKLLCEISTSDTNSDRVIEARGLLYQFNPSFIRLLFALRYIFKFTKNASDCLQSSELDYSKALELLEVLQEKVTECREDSKMQIIWNESEQILSELGFTDSEKKIDAIERRSQRTTRIPNQLEHFVVEAPIEKEKLENKESFKREIFSLIDRLNNEIDRRFFMQNKAILLGIKALVPNSETFLETDDIVAFAELYKINTDDIKIELENMIRVMARKKDTCKPTNLLEFQNYVSRMSDAFYNLNILLKIACTMPVTTCACERSFSTLRIVKNYMRSTMKENRLESLMILGVHGSRAKKLNLDSIVQKFDILYPQSRIQLH